MIDTNPSQLVLPDRRIVRPRIEEGDDGIQRVAGLMTRSEWRQLEAVLRSKYFLFRNNGNSQFAERMVCRTKMPDGSWRGCGLVHPYITCMHVEMPFRGGEGLEEGFWLSYRVATDEVRQNQLLKAISRVPDIASGHPFTARDLQPESPGENWLAVLVSLPEPITRAQAVKFADRINERNPPSFFDIGPP